ANVPMHGKLSPIRHHDSGVFAGLPNPFDATRYHSLIVERASLPAALAITAETNDGIVMGLEHRERPVHGVQFHPESIASQGGYRLLKNFLALAAAKSVAACATRLTSKRCWRNWRRVNACPKARRPVRSTP
ncbi:MAG: anthranilate synthase component II, partial [Stellaceae bacterium]